MRWPRPLRLCSCCGFLRVLGAALVLSTAALVASLQRASDDRGAPRLRPPSPQQSPPLGPWRLEKSPWVQNDTRHGLWLALERLATDSAPLVLTLDDPALLPELPCPTLPLARPEVPGCSASWPEYRDSPGAKRGYRGWSESVLRRLLAGTLAPGLRDSDAVRDFLAHSLHPHAREVVNQALRRARSSANKTLPPSETLTAPDDPMSLPRLVALSDPARLALRAAATDEAFADACRSLHQAGTRPLSAGSMVPSSPPQLPIVHLPAVGDCPDTVLWEGGSPASAGAARAYGNASTAVICSRAAVEAWVVREHVRTRWPRTRGQDRSPFAACPGAARAGTCAVVGSAGSLLGSKHGAAIDAHDVVFRMNDAPTAGYEADVGRRTSWRVFNSEGPEQLWTRVRPVHSNNASHSAGPSSGAQHARHREELGGTLTMCLREHCLRHWATRVADEVLNGDAADAIAEFGLQTQARASMDGNGRDDIRAMQRRLDVHVQNPEALTRIERAADSHLLIHPSLLCLLRRVVPAALFPSTGLVAAALATRCCASVTLFGFEPDAYAQAGVLARYFDPESVRSIRGAHAFNEERKALFALVNASRAGDPLLGAVRLVLP